MAAHLKENLLHGKDHLDTHASDSRWRHQEGHSFAEHARDTSRVRDASLGPSIDGSKTDSALTKTQDEPAPKRQTARKHLGLSSNLADFLNDSRISPPPDGKGKHTPIFVKGSHGKEFADGIAARSSNGHALQEEAAALLGTGVGWEVKCGPLLNYRRMEDNVWYGSVLIIVKSAQTGDIDRTPVLELKKVWDGNISYEEGLPDATKSAISTASNSSADNFVTPRTTLSTIALFNSEASQNRSNSNGNNLEALNSNSTGKQLTETETSPANHSLRGQTLAAGIETPIADDNSNESAVKIEGTKLYSDPQNTFFRYDIQVPMLATEQRISYTISDLHFPVDVKKTSSQYFYVPAKTESMRMMFHSCNGFSVGTDEEAWSGAALWNDVLRVHEKRPFHIMLGGGDQIYNDGIRVHGPLRKWTDVKNPIKRREYPFPESLRKECDDYYAQNYIRWYSTEPFSSANGQIPQLNLWDDHDIIDGFGSYVSEFMQCPVFRGIGGVAHKYYMLFQHHLAPPQSTYTTDAPETMEPGLNGVGADPSQSIDTFVFKEKSEDPSYIIGAKPGPYVAEHSRSIYTRLGARIAFFGIDARTERTRHQVNYPETYDLIFARLRKELSVAASTASPIQHLIVLLGIPIAYPRLTWLENIFTSPVMGPIKFLNKRFGLAGGLFNHFDGSVDLLDDLDDHYTAKAHKKERFLLVRQFQDLAAEFSVRISFLGGDVHLAALGRFYSNPALNIPVGADHRYMCNVISSAIVNKPPPAAIANLLARRNKIHHLDKDTDETLFKLFDKDPGAEQKTAHFNHVTMPSRNWAMITENSITKSLPRSHVLENSSEEPFNATAPIPEPVQRNTTSANRNLAVNGNSDRPTTAATMPSSGGPNKLRKTPSSIGNTSNSYRSKTGSNISAFRDGHFPLHPGEEGAGTSHRAAGGNHGTAGDGSLDVVIRVEIDQHDREGKTMGYGLQIPPLNYHASLTPLTEVVAESQQVDDQNVAAPVQIDAYADAKGVYQDSRKDSPIGDSGVSGIASASTEHTDRNTTPTQIE